MESATRLTGRDTQSSREISPPNCSPMYPLGVHSTRSVEITLASYHLTVGNNRWKSPMWAEKVYPLLPIPLQNVAMSMKGFELHRQRYRGTSFHEMSDRLLRNEQLSWADLSLLQFALFREFATHCYTQSPYYKKLWQSHQLRPED